MEYIFKYRKKWRWQSKLIEGHRLDQENNRMDLFMKNGSIFSIGNWSQYDLNLGSDWVLATKKKMEEEAGVDIKLNGNKGI